MMAQAYNPSTQEAGAGGQPGLHDKGPVLKSELCLKCHCCGCYVCCGCSVGVNVYCWCSEDVTCVVGALRVLRVLHMCSTSSFYLERVNSCFIVP